jgi:hypothetical protein
MSGYPARGFRWTIRDKILVGGGGATLDDATLAAMLQNSLERVTLLGLGFSILKPVSVKTGNYSTPGNELIPVNATGSVFNIQLPTAPQHGTLSLILDPNHTTLLHSVTILPGSGDQVLLNSAGQLLDDGTNLFMYYDSVPKNWTEIP